jgi:hypothetical protein
VGNATRRRVAGLLAAAALLAAAPVAQAPAGAHAPAVAAKTCSSGFKHAVILGVQKCLRKGEYCKHTKAANHDYAKYGYHCGKRDASGRYHLTYS